jgi:peptidyl-prolyl cis-trans isomerase D
MLNILRKRAQSTLIQGMVLLIAVVFIFWGVGTNLNNNRNSIAEVNGVEIPIQDYQRAYDRAVEKYRRQFGGQVPSGFFEGINLKGQVVGQLIQEELLRQGALSMGLTISKEAIRRQVEKMPAFQRDGHFDLGRYKSVLESNKLTPTSFEGGIRSDILTNFVVDAIGSFAVQPEAEVRRWLDYSGEEIKLAVKAIKSSDFEDKVEVKDAELSSWFEQHKKEYASEPKIRLRYLLFDSNKVMNQVSVSDDTLKTRYESELEKYRIPEQRHVRHILFKVSEQDDKQTVAKKKKEAEKVLALANAGKDFAGLAQQYSEGPTKKNGGDLGFFPRGRMVKAFDDAVFSMPQGTISNLVRTPFGFHIIKLEAIRPGRVRPFDEVKDELAKIMKEEEAKGLAFKKSSAAYEGIMRAGSIDKYSKQENVSVIQTDYFSRSRPSADIVTDPAFLQAAFKLGKGELSSLVELNKGYAILFVDDIQPSTVPSLADVRDRVVEDYRREKAVDLARQAAGKELAQVKEQGKLSGKDVHETGYVKRGTRQMDSVPGEVIVDAFSLAPKVQLPDHPVGVGNTFYLYQVRDRRQSVNVANAGKKEQLKQQLSATERARLLTDWLADLQKNAEIWTNEAILK